MCAFGSKRTNVETNGGESHSTNLPAPEREDAGARRSDSGRAHERTGKRRRPAPGSIQQSVEAAVDALRRAALGVARSRGLEHAIGGVEIRVRLGRDSNPAEMSEEFFEELIARLDELQSEEDLVVPNRAYCFRCESFLCPHSRTKDPRAILAGYEPAGRPQWADFVSWMLNRRDERWESARDGVAAVVTPGEELLRDRIVAFGGERPFVEVLAQVSAGMFPLGGGGDEGALTVQWLRVRGPASEKLVLHPIADPRLLSPAGPGADGDLHRILAAARSAVRKKTARGRQHKDSAASQDSLDSQHSLVSPHSLVSVARSLAAELARDLQHCFQVRARRTHHARERAADRERPTSHAFPEARSAADESILVDRATRAIVLLGKNARVHFFNGEGRHVTSVRFAGDAIRARIGAGRWRPATPKEISQFRSRLAGDGGR
jgi:hypothetical protein